MTTGACSPIRPAAAAERPYEDRQRRPDDKEAMEGQRPVAIHALEHPVSSDKGVRMLRQMLRRQLDALAAGRDTINVVRDSPANHASPAMTHDRTIMGWAGGRGRGARPRSRRSGDR
jgi:hypothetical protein